MWLVRNVKTNRSNVINANNILFTRFVSSQIFCDDRSPWVFFCRNNVMCQLLYDIIYHPIPAILNIWEDMGDWQPCIDDPLVLTCVGFSICKWQMSIIIWLSSEAGRYNASASCDVDGIFVFVDHQPLAVFLSSTLFAWWYLTVSWDFTILILIMLKTFKKVLHPI